MSQAQEKAATDRIQLRHDEAGKRVDVTIDGKPFTSYIYSRPRCNQKPVLNPIGRHRVTAITGVIRWSHGPVNA